MKLFSSQTSLVSYFPISAFAQSQRLKTSVSSLFDTTVCCQLYFIFPQQYLHTLPHIIPIPSLIVHTTLLFILTVAFYQVSNDLSSDQKLPTLLQHLKNKYYFLGCNSNSPRPCLNLYPVSFIAHLPASCFAVNALNTYACLTHFDHIFMLIFLFGILFHP